MKTAGYRYKVLCYCVLIFMSVALVHGQSPNPSSHPPSQLDQKSLPQSQSPQVLSPQSNSTQVSFNTIWTAQTKKAWQQWNKTFGIQTTFLPKIKVLDGHSITKFIADRLQQFYHPAKHKALEKLLKLYHLIPNSVDYLATLTHISQFFAAGLYDPSTQSLIIKNTLPATHKENVLMHELFHAWQDTHFDIQKTLTQTHDTIDAHFAMQAFLEADAILMSLPSSQAHILNASTQDFHLWLQSFRQKLLQSIEIFTQHSSSSLPTFIIHQLIDPYIWGLRWIYTLHQVKAKPNQAVKHKAIYTKQDSTQHKHMIVDEQNDRSYMHHLYQSPPVSMAQLLGFTMSLTSPSFTPSTPTLLQSTSASTSLTSMEWMLNLSSTTDLFILFYLLDQHGLSIQSNDQANNQVSYIWQQDQSLVDVPWITTLGVWYWMQVLTHQDLYSTSQALQILRAWRMDWNLVWQNFTCSISIWKNSKTAQQFAHSIQRWHTHAMSVFTMHLPSGLSDKKPSAHHPPNSISPNTYVANPSSLNPSSPVNFSYANSLSPLFLPPYSSLLTPLSNTSIRFSSSHISPINYSWNPLRIQVQDRIVSFCLGGLY